MADPILVSTAEELMTALNGSTNVDKTIKVIGDIDFNRGQYSDWEKNFFESTSSVTPPSTITLDGSWEDSQGNTQNRTISNIFIYPGWCLFYNQYSTSTKLICKNITFEIVSNSGAIINTSKQCIFENCIFNVRLYSNRYVQFYAPNNRVDGILTFKNCVFNFYITSSSSSTMTLIKAPANNSDTNVVYPVIIKSCIFKIRNATNKFITLVENAGNYYLPAKIYNSAIFYNDVGAVQPPYSLDKSNGQILNCHHITSPSVCVKNRIMNTYISSFDYYPLPAGFVKPIIVAFNYDSSSGTKIPDCISASFYDGSKIDVYMNYVSDNSTIVDNYTGYLTKLTTEQCKDPAKLSEIGYMFSEET